VWIETNRIGERDVGKRLISVGYGITSAATQQGAGTRRSAPIEIAAVEGQFIVSYTAQNPGEGNVCSGDSGGPQYFENEDGTLTQWSVHSWADQNCQFASGSSRTDVGQEWILNQVERVHGTTDRCEIYGMYANGVCDEACDQVDPECSLAQGGEATDEAGGGPTDGKACGCTHTEPGHAAAASLGLLALLRRRART
jgi:MYXO-CTERM domain-containing protein